MDNIERAYFTGFVKAAAGHPIGGKALEALEAAKQLMHPPHTAPRVPEQFELPLWRQLGLFDNPPTQQAKIDPSQFIAPAKPSMLSGLADKTKNKLMNASNWAEAHPVKTTAGALGALGLGAGADSLIARSNTGPSENILEAVKAKQGTPPWYETLKGSIGDHPYLWGGGALAGMGGLAYLLRNRQNKDQDQEQQLNEF